MSAEAGSPAPQPAAGGAPDGTAGTAPQVEMQRLWQMYLTLSQELLKFIGREDVDEFLDIVPQRGTVVEKMQALPADVMTAFRRSAEGQALAREIKPLDMQILYKAKAWLNKSKRQNAMVRSYDLTAQKLNPLGNLVNRKY